MPTIKSKHTIAEIEGVRCTIVESDATSARVEFLKDLLEFNKYTVKVIANKSAGENQPLTYTIGVADVLFNPVIAIYERALKTKDGYKVTPAFWLEQSRICDPRYWRAREVETGDPRQTYTITDTIR
ncbi:MAG: hypothetical protein WCM76_13255 [Bacteroidota bacterium]